MEFINIKEKSRIRTIIHHLISKRSDISVKIKDSDEIFSTKLIKLDEQGGLDRIIIEKLYPDHGNTIIQSSPEAMFSFDLSGSWCRFTTNYCGINARYPDFGLIIGFPGIVQIDEKRRDTRIEDEFTKLLSVEFALEGDDKVYKLRVINLGTHGVALIVDKKNFDILYKVNVGDKIHNLQFFLPAAALMVDGKVKHKTKMKQGRLKGKYIIGVESEFIMKNLKKAGDEGVENNL